MDRKLYKNHMQNFLFNYPNLDVRAGSVFDLVFSPTVPAAYESSSSPNVLAAIDGVRLGSYLALSVPVASLLICHQTQARSLNVLKSFFARAHSCLEKSTLVG
jgi:hypothetical protein